MTITNGLTPQGLNTKPLSQITSELGAALKAGPLGASAGTNPDGSIPVESIAGQIIAFMADPLAALWDLSQALYASFDPNSATGNQEDVLLSLRGSLRNPAIASSSIVTCCGVPGTVLPVGRQVAQSATSPLFQNQDAPTIGAVAAYASGTNQHLGDRVTVGGAVYQCTSPGINGGALSALTGITPGTVETDGMGGCVWLCIGLGTGAVDDLFTAVVAGPTGATAGTLNTIITPVFGWSTAYNVLDASVGQTQESDTTFRLRSEAEIHGDANGAADAIRAKILAVGQGTDAPVTACSVFTNDTDVTNGLAMPPHSVMVLADYDGPDNPTLDQAIAQAIWDSVGAGIATTYGQASGSGYAFTATVTDSQGTAQTVRWARPEPVEIYVVATVTYDNTPGVFPSNGLQQLAGGVDSSGTDWIGSLPGYGATYPAGKNVWASALIAAIFGYPPGPGLPPVPGILSVSTPYIGTAPSPGSSTPITISFLQRAVFETANISLTLVGAAP